jgi:hypothetical protein
VAARTGAKSSRLVQQLAKMSYGHGARPSHRPVPATLSRSAPTNL